MLYSLRKGEGPNYKDLVYIPYLLDQGKFPEPVLQCTSQHSRHVPIFGSLLFPNVSLTLENMNLNLTPVYLNFICCWQRLLLQDNLHIIIYPTISTFEALISHILYHLQTTHIINPLLLPLSAHAYTAHTHNGNELIKNLAHLAGFNFVYRLISFNCWWWITCQHKEW